MAMTRAQIELLLKPGANKIFGAYDSFPEEWKDIYKPSDSNMAEEWDIENRFFSYGQLKTEGGAIPRDVGAGQRYTTRYNHKEFGLSFVMTRPALDDNLYKKQFPEAAKELRNSMSAFKNYLAALFILQGSTINRTADGQFAFSATHPFDGGTYSNIVNADLNETSLEAAKLLAASYVSLAGVKIPARLEKLIVGPELDFTASRLTKSEYRTDTPNNDRNPIMTTGLLPKGYAVNRFFNILPGIKPWLVLTDINFQGPGFRLFQRIKLEHNVRVDEDTMNIITNVYERYSLGLSNPRAGIFAPGS